VVDHIDARRPPIDEPLTVRCWNCDHDVLVDRLPLWGICWDCMTATGEDGLWYVLDEVPGSLQRMGRIQWKARLISAVTV
jgi:hypothetical protein